MSRQNKLKKFNDYCESRSGEISDPTMKMVAALSFAVGYLGSLLTDEQVERLPGE